MQLRNPWLDYIAQAIIEGLSRLSKQGGEKDAH